jgi:hypothetical protein
MRFGPWPFGADSCVALSDGGSEGVHDRARCGTPPPLIRPPTRAAPRAYGQPAARSGRNSRRSRQDQSRATNTLRGRPLDRIADSLSGDQHPWHVLPWRLALSCAADAGGPRFEWPCSGGSGQHRRRAGPSGHGLRHRMPSRLGLRHARLVHPQRIALRCRKRRRLHGGFDLCGRGQVCDARRGLCGRLRRRLCPLRGVP